MKREAVDLFEGQVFENETERRELEFCIRRCNRCVHADDESKSCRYDPENPVRLSTYTNAVGYCYLLKPKFCENYTFDNWRGGDNGS